MASFASAKATGPVIVFQSSFLRRHRVTGLLSNKTLYTTINAASYLLTAMFSRGLSSIFIAIIRILQVRSRARRMCHMCAWA